MVAGYLYLQGWWDRAPATEEAEVTASASPVRPAPAAGEPSAEATLARASAPALPKEQPGMRVEPESLSPVIREAQEKLEAGDYEEALSLMKGLLPGDRRALAGVGLVYYKMGEYPLAIEYLEQSLEEGVNEFLSLKFLAFAHYRQEELSRSLKRTEEALALQPDRELADLKEKLKRELRARGSSHVAEQSRHFKVVFDGYKHGAISRTVLDILEDAYRDLGQKMDYFPSRTVTVVLYTEKNFFDVTLLPAWTAGAFDGKIRLPVKGVEQEAPGKLRQVLYHEYVHAMLYDMAPGRLPHWLNEGLAEYLVPRGLAKTGQVLPLRSLTDSFPVGNQRTMMLAYSESYSAVAHLADAYGLWKVKELILALGRGEDLDSAFQSAFYLGYEDFLRDWGKEGSTG
jgi:tetratricopeptide (TPR) repeat protein